MIYWRNSRVPLSTPPASYSQTDPEEKIGHAGYFRKYRLECVKLESCRGNTRQSLSAGYRGNIRVVICRQTEVLKLGITVC